MASRAVFSYCLTFTQKIVDLLRETLIANTKNLDTMWGLEIDRSHLSTPHRQRYLLRKVKCVVAVEQIGLTFSRCSWTLYISGEFFTCPLRLVCVEISPSLGSFQMALEC